MTIFFVVFTICLFNIAMWIVFLSKFKKLFSTDDIIAKARLELDEMLKEINRNADRNITLLEDKINQIKIVTQDAEKRINVLKNDISNIEKAIKESEPTTIKSVPKRRTSKKALTPEEQYRKEQENFSKNTSATQKSDLPQILQSENIKKIIPKKSFREKVVELFDRGMSIDEIASEVGRSTQEVEFILEIS